MTKLDSDSRVRRGTVEDIENARGFIISRREHDLVVQTLHDFGFMTDEQFLGARSLLDIFSPRFVSQERAFRVHAARFGARSFSARF